MAKVIGFDDNAKSRVTCSGRKLDPGCGAIVEYTKADMRSYSGTDYGGGSDGMEWVDCPNCRKRIVLRSW